MDDFQIIKGNYDRKEKKSAIKIFFIIFALVISSAAVAAFSYRLGTKFSGDASAPEIHISPTGKPKTTLSEKSEIPTVVFQKPPTTAKISPTSIPTPSIILKTKILPASSDLDGFRSSNGSGSMTSAIRAGRNSNQVNRGFVSFDISAIPSEANVQSAVLKLYQAEVTGNPYASCGDLKIDHLTYGDKLDDSDYGSPAIISGFTVLSENAKIGWKEIDVAAKFKDDLANARYLSQFRIHFETEIKGTNEEGDFVYFEAKENSLKTGNIPQLVIKYY